MDENLTRRRIKSQSWTRLLKLHYRETGGRAGRGCDRQFYLEVQDCHQLEISRGVFWQVPQKGSGPIRRKDRDHKGTFYAVPSKSLAKDTYARPMSQKVLLRVER